MNKDTEIKQGQKLETGNKSTVKINPTKESLKEVLTKSTSVKDVVHDFVHSKNAKFSKDSTKQRIKRALGAWYGMHPEKSTKEEFVNEGDFWHPDPEKDRKLGGPGANQRAREDGTASKPKEDPKKLRPGESYMQYAKRHGYKSKNESHVPGQPAERLGAVTAIPQSERDAAKARILAKAAAKRKEAERTQKEEFEINEAEGSYGQTPKATAAYGALANKRRNTPASEYPQRGAKKVAVKSAERHMSRSENPDAGNRGKQSTKPHWTSGSRKGMTPKDRNWRRGADEYGHSGYDGEGGGGSLPKGKKLTRQRKTGVSAESFDLYDIILSHLFDEGYADTEQAAEAIMVNMSEDWRESIVEEVLDEAIRNPESRKKLRDIMNIDKGRKGDASKGENPRSKYPSERSKQALNLLHGSGETGSKDNPVRSRGGTSAPPEERSRSAANRKYWAATAGPTRDRGAGNKAARRASELSKEEFEIDESAIGDRARNAVADQRLDAAQRDTQQSVDKLAKRGKVTRAGAQIAAKRVEADVRKSSSYGPQRPKPGTTGAYRIEETEIDEATRFEKETGKDYKTGKEVTKGGTLSGNDTNTKVMRHMHKVMGAGRMGSNGPIQPRGQKKVPGKKPPEAGKYGSERRSPEQIVKNRRAARQQGQDNQSSRFD
jgi:hypothetical protein